jgi:hypothetical protein
MADLQIKRPMAVGRRGKEGVSVWLLASRDDIDQGNTNGPAQVYDERSRTFTAPLPLQQWFKFVAFPGVEEGTLLPFDAPEDDDANALYDEKAERLIVQMTGAVKGGPGSGYHDPHVGLPGVHGGSQPREGYVWEKIKHGKKPKPATGKPKTPKEPPKQYPLGTPDSISDAADDEDEVSAPAKRGKPKGAPVSKAARVEAKGKVGKAINETLAAIDEVHGDGELGELPFQKNSGTRTTGKFEYYLANRKPIRIVVSDKGKTPSLDTAHEIGHWLDHVVLSTGNANSAYFANLKNPDYKATVERFWEVVDRTDSIRRLDELKTKGGTVKMEVSSDSGYLGLEGEKTKVVDVPADGRYVRYLARRDEVWARAYSQYVATRSSSSVLKSELTERQGRNDGYPAMWSDEDFAPVADAIDNLFKTMGWLE